MQEHARVVIVGGGNMGCGLLYHLAEEGWTDIVLIEKAELTSGSTWHAAGQCPSFVGSYNLAKMHHYSNTLYPKLEEMTGQYVSWHGSGGVRLAYTDVEVDWFKHVAGFAPNIGFHMEIIGPNEIRNLVPHLDVDGVQAGAYTNLDGHVDPAGVCNAMAAGAKQMGAAIERQTLVTDINRLESGEWEVVTDKGTITCEHVVNAAGCYAREVAQMVGSDVPITNMLHQFFVTDTVEEFVDSDVEMPVIRDPRASCYYRQEQKSGLIGVYETAADGAAEAWAPKGTPEWESESELFEADFERSMPHLEKVLARMPIWAELGIKRVVHGAIPHTPDANPLLGPAGGLPNYWMCNGSAIGIAQGAGSGKYLAQWMVHGDSEINMFEFDPRRFGDWCTEDYVRAKSFEDYNRMYALPAPGEELPTGRPRRKTPVYEKLVAQGGVHTVAFGWERPKWFSPDGREEDYGYRRNNLFDLVGEECKAVRERVGVLDLSSFAKFDVTGPGAEALLNRVYANRMSKKDGGIVLAHMLSDGGRIQSESTITRLAADRFYVLSGAAWEVQDYDRLTAAIEDGDVNVMNVTDDYGTLVVAGPRSRDLLATLTDADLTTPAFRWLTGQEIDIAGVTTRALRVNYVGELGWELHMPMGQMESLYDAVMQAGAEHGIANFGVYAVNSLRLEKSYRGGGVELTNEISLIEADMERFLKLDRDNFIGRDATQQVLDGGIVTKLVYGEIEVDDADVRGGESVYAGDKCMGVATSGGYGYAVGKSLFFAYVEPEYAAPGSTFDIQVLGERRKAAVLAEPAYDPANERLRA